MLNCYVTKKNIVTMSFSHSVGNFLTDLSRFEKRLGNFAVKGI